MKKMIFALTALAVLFPFALFADDGVVMPSGLYTDRLSYEIFGPNGSVVDATVYDRKIGLPYDEAMLLKYVRMTRCIGQEVNTAVDASQNTGDFGDFLKEQLQQ